MMINVSVNLFTIASLSVDFLSHAALLVLVFKGRSADWWSSGAFDGAKGRDKGIFLASHFAVVCDSFVLDWNVPVCDKQTHHSL